MKVRRRKGTQRGEETLTEQGVGSGRRKYSGSGSYRWLGRKNTQNYPLGRRSGPLACNRAATTDLTGAGLVGLYTRAATDLGSVLTNFRDIALCAVPLF